MGPGVDLSRDVTMATVARVLAGVDGEVVSLRQPGVRNLSRPLTQAEVALLRGALLGESAPTPRRRGANSLVGYVCAGVVPAGAAAAGARVVAVTDHVNLTWRSPLEGRNDSTVGPRFPSMTGIYASEAVLERVGPEGGIIVEPGVVAGVGDAGRLDAYESEAVLVGRLSAVSAELVPVVIVAAHMGLRIAAAVVVMAGSSEQETGSGRS